MYAVTDEIEKKFLEKILPLRSNLSEIYLFGSRQRDDWRPDSDYDFLIVMSKKDKEVIDGLYDAVLDILLETGRLISLKIFAACEFDRLKALSTPFMRNVMREGVRIGLND